MKIRINGVIVPNTEKWIYDYFGIEAICPKDINAILDELEENEDVLVEINSDGGEISAGSEIYEALRSCNNYVKIKVVGLAASAASVIACAGYSEIAPTAMIMVHNVSSTAQGDYHAMDKSSEILQEANKSIAAAYREKTGKSEAELLQLMDEETWLTAEKAVEYGLIDKISESAQGKMKLVASYSTKMLSREVIEKMQAQKAKERMQAQLDLLQII